MACGAWSLPLRRHADFRDNERWRRGMQLIKRLFLLGLVLYLGLWALRIVSRKMYVWLPGYLSWAMGSQEQPSGPVHLFFMFADHFEPGERYEFTERWLNEY